MPLSESVKQSVYDYCNKHLADDQWYQNEFEFIQDEPLRTRIIQEFKGIRFAYKLYEGIGATDENLIFEIRHQIFAYATIYEAIIHHLLYTYYEDTQEFHDMQYHMVPAKISIPAEKKRTLEKALCHDNSEIIPYRLQERKKDDSQIRFDDKCKTAEKLGLVVKFPKQDGTIVNLPNELIEIYGYRNAIHLAAELRKGIEYELELSKLAYKRMRPFIDQVKAKLQEDGKSIYASTNDDAS